MEQLPIFVYGTLKRGEVRESNWPHPPAEIRNAMLRAALYDLGPYPAIAKGSDCVAGELWFMREEHLAKTLAVLDEIECFGQDDVDLYVREIALCETDRGEQHRAYTYFYADESELRATQRILPDQHGRCRWTANR